MYSIEDIVKNDLCIGCGICISESTTSKMIWNENGFLVPNLDDSFNENAIKVCPFNPAPEEGVRDEDQLANIFLQEATSADKRVGKFEGLYVGFSNEYRESSSSGGLATYVFEELLKQKIVDHLFIVKELEGNYGYQWFNNIEQIKEISKTRYYPVTLQDLFKEINQKEGKVAISGVACFIKAIRLKQYYNPVYKEKIPFLIGIICGGVKSSFFTDYLAQKAGIEGKYSKAEYRIKDPNSRALDYSFGAFDKDEKFYQMKMKTVGDMWGTGLFKNNACDFCDDVTTELADISLGDAWLKPYSQDGKGTSVIVTRTKIADALIQKGIHNKELSVQEFSLANFKSSQQGSFRHRQLGLKYRLKKLKKSIFLYKRKRLLESVPIEYKIVLRQRMEIRDQSFKIWKKSHNSEQFESEILNYKQELIKKTKRYHFVQVLRKKIGLKRM